MTANESLDAYPSYTAALSLCGKGYDDPELAQVMLTKTQRLIHADLKQILYGPFVTALIQSITSAADQRIGAGPVTVLDFGGNFGLYYFLCRQMTTIPLRWAIVESTTMARIGGALASGELQFFSELNSAHRWLHSVDLVFANGSLQYSPDPVTTLSDLIALGAREILFLRTSISTGASRITVQESVLSANGPGGLPPGVADRQIRYPRTFTAWQTVLDLATPQYQIHSLPRDEREIRVELAAGTLDPGWCARLKKLSA